MFLTDTDISSLTGLSRPSAQIRWLREHDFPHEVGADGKPKVLKSYVQQRLGGTIEVFNEPRLHL